MFRSAIATYKKSCAPLFQGKRGKLLASLLLSILWVSSYQYKYNVSAFNTDCVNIWALSLWIVGGYVFLELYSIVQSKTTNSILRLAIGWLVYFAGLILMEYIGYYVLEIRESSLRHKDALIMGLVHGTPILHVYYVLFPFIIIPVYGVVTTPRQWLFTYTKVANHPLIQKI